MSIEININVNDTAASTHEIGGNALESASTAGLRTDFNELMSQMGDEIKPFPRARLGGYMSHFKLVFEINPGPDARLISIVSPLAAQTVAWSDPFIYEGPERQHEVEVPLPTGSKLSSKVRESDFIERPEGFFEVGKETMWLQILNLDARMDSEIGPIRIILGETLLREHPDVFRPSLGVAQALGSSGFPASLYFNPYALIETPLGTFRAIHGTLSYGRVTNFPPIGTPVSISKCIPLENVDHLRSLMKEGAVLESLEDDAVESIGRIIALSHPIDMEIQLEGEDIYNFVEDCIARKYVNLQTQA
ncbi:MULTISPECIES: hypothetical protein [unclassified Novosphingobium]|uniref:hypothetical protein n=1 Tax=unclassified Novosphingobium TaxID=2644732 RepID=UPI000EE90630|nr:MULTISPECIES: hypothetical protein [unclassified Novosphingobium]HCF24927.1 hypothetical protein [Novosphingobium sp.]HQV03166.1 hypothetical protein [Novosphingobium sp.]